MDAPPTDSVHADGAMADASSADATDSPSAKIHRAFVTTGRWNGALGGIAGADAKCQDEATAAALTGTYLAWLGDNTTNPATRFTKDGAYVRTDGVVIANSWSDLVDGTLGARLVVNADGTASSSVDWVWSNVDVDGTTDFPIYECEGWTLGSIKDGAIADPAYTDARWTHFAATSCFFEARLYCFEQ